MALLVKEQRALAQLEQSLVNYYAIMLGEEIQIDRNLSVEERLLVLSVHINGLL